MNHDQIVQLLQIASGYDNRNIDGIIVTTWSEAARRAGWSYESAADAINDHYAASSTWLMPGHVTERIRLKSRQPAPVNEVLALDKPPASPERRAELMAEIRKIADRKAIK